MPVKVVTIATDYLPKIGGISNHVHFLNKHLSAAGVDCHVLHIVERSGRDDLEVSGGDYTVHRLFIRDDLADFRKLKYRHIVGRLLREKFGDADIIHTHEFLTTEYLVDRRRFKWVWTNHTSQFVAAAAGRGGNPIKIWLEKQVLRRADAVLCVSEEVSRITKAFLKRDTGIHTIGHGIEVERFAGAGGLGNRSARAGFGIPVDRFVVLIPAGWRMVKGIHVAVRAMNRLRDEDPDEAAKVWYVFAGSGAGEPSYIEEQKQRLAEHANYTLIDAVDYEDMPALYSAADLVLVPSLYETAGIVALEAMAAGIPVLGPEIGGLKEVLIDGQTGFTYEAGDVKGLVKALRRVLREADEENCRQIVNQAREYVRVNRDWSVVARSVMETYEEVLR